MLKVLLRILSKLAPSGLCYNKKRRTIKWSLGKWIDALKESDDVEKT